MSFVDFLKIILKKVQKSKNYEGILSGTKMNIINLSFVDFLKIILKKDQKSKNYEGILSGIKMNIIYY